VQRGEKPIAGAITCEDAAGPVTAVSSGREADHDDAGPRVAEAGQRPRPIALAPITLGRVVGHALAPGDQPGTETAGGDLARERFEQRRQACLRSCSATVRSRASERRINRDTCIWETPIRSAISDWVMSSTKRRCKIRRSRAVRALSVGAIAAPYSTSS